MKRILIPSCVALLVIALLGCDERNKLQQAHLKADGQQSSEVESNNNGSKIADSSTESGETLFGDASQGTPAEPNDLEYGDKFPKVLAVETGKSNSDRVRFDVTLSSPYDSSQRYADAWRVLDENDNELGIRILGHDHASEQPFTRSHSIEIPSNVKFVFVEGRDAANGWSGQRFKVELP